MRERKYVKFRVDMHEDTKFKIIDMKPERDLINYVWTRFVTLAGKVNLEGDLYMSKSLPYTIETLAIEFNRCVDQIRLALDVFHRIRNDGRANLEINHKDIDEIYSNMGVLKSNNSKDSIPIRLETRKNIKVSKKKKNLRTYGKRGDK